MPRANSKDRMFENKMKFRKCILRSSQKMNIACQLINENHRNKIILSTKPSFLGKLHEEGIDYTIFLLFQLS